MPCYFPTPAYQDAPGKPVRLHPPLGTANLELPCGRCLGCKDGRAKQWASRIMHEAGQHAHNCFVTLTYDDDHLPVDRQLNPRHLQLFLKRLRKEAAPNAKVHTTSRVRFFACGEYGATTGRAHYHLILFDCCFNDAKMAGKNLYSSKTLADIWGKGECRIGEVTAASALYCAMYSLKASSNPGVDVDGVCIQKPFVRMSLRPGIGVPWLNKYAEDLRHGYLIRDGVRLSVPRSYKVRLQRDNPALADQIAAKAGEAARLRSDDARTPERRSAASEIHSLKVAARRLSEVL